MAPEIEMSRNVGDVERGFIPLNIDFLSVSVSEKLGRRWCCSETFGLTLVPVEIL
jgi:hypothetical protein